MTQLTDSPVDHLTARSAFLPFALPDTDETEVDEVAATIRSGWLTTGAKTRQFEAEFAAFLGACHAVAVNSCTAAMHLTLEALGFQAGDLVLTTALTFAATAEGVRYFGATPLFVDVDPETLNTDPACLAHACAALAQGGPAAQPYLPPSLRSSSVRSPTSHLPLPTSRLPPQGHHARLPRRPGLRPGRHRRCLVLDVSRRESLLHGRLRSGREVGGV